MRAKIAAIERKLKPPEDLPRIITVWDPDSVPKGYEVFPDGAPDDTESAESVVAWNSVRRAWHEHQIAKLGDVGDVRWLIDHEDALTVAKWAGTLDRLGRWDWDLYADECRGAAAFCGSHPVVGNYRPDVEPEEGT